MNNEQHACRLQRPSVREAAPIAADNASDLRMRLHQQGSNEEEKDETPLNKKCGNRFCRQTLSNRYAKFCEDKCMCQRYRALQIQCLANEEADNKKEETDLSVVVDKVDVCPLWLQRQSYNEEEKEKDETPLNTKCGNRFCRQTLPNRYAKFCEDKRMCQRYRALKLQCLANMQTVEDEKETKPLSLVLQQKEGERKETKETEDMEEMMGKKGGKKEKVEKKDDDDEMFVILKRKKTSEMCSSAIKENRLNLNATAYVVIEEKRGNSSSLCHKEKVLRNEKKRDLEKKLSDTKEKQRNKRARNAQETMESKGVDDRFSRSSSSVRVPAIPLTDKTEVLTQRKKKITVPLVRQSAEACTGTETERESSSIQVKRHRLDPKVNIDKGLGRSTLLSPTGATSVASGADLRWKTYRAKPGQAKTSAQAIRAKTNVDFVPLGVSNQTKFAGGGGRYVQNGNRFAVQSVRPSDPRPRPPHLANLSSSVASAPLSALMPNTSSRPAQKTTAPPPPPLQTRRPLPQLFPQASSLAQPVPRPTAGVAVPLSLPVKDPVVEPMSDRPSTSGLPEITRISTTDYLKSKKEENGRHHQSGKEGNSRPLQSTSLEHSGSVDNNLGSFGFAVEPRRPNPEGNGIHQRPYFGVEGSMMKYRKRSEVCGELERFASAQRKSRNLSPPRVRYPLRSQALPSIDMNKSGYDHPVDIHYNSASSSADQAMWRGLLQEDSPPPQYVPISSRGEEDVGNERRRSDYGILEASFSYHDEFLPQLLSVFIRKFPQALEAVLNKTKKPRKMSWYITYIQRIEHLCKAFDLHVKLNGLKAMVTVQGREWLTLQGTSTLSLYLEVIRSLRAEAVTWLILHEEMKTAYCLSASQVNESYVFLRAWNELKHAESNISLPREVNYFCGARLHHWNFVVGKVEIGNGSHEEKREAFRLATISALDFLLSLGRRARRPAIKRERVVEDERCNGTVHHRGGSRESFLNNGTSASLATESKSGLSPEMPPAGLSSSVAPLPPPAAEPRSVVESIYQQRMTCDDAEKPFAEAPVATTHSAFDGKLQSSVRTATSPTTAKRTEEATVVSTSIATSDCSHKLVEAAEQSGVCEELISCGPSDMNAVTPATSLDRAITPPDGHANVLESAAILAVSTMPATASSSVPAAVMSTTSITKESTLPHEGMTRTAVLTTTMTDCGVSAAAKIIPTTQLNAIIPLRRCMMCEMIRMRKPDGERCLRCKQNDAPANRALPTLVGLDVAPARHKL